MSDFSELRARAGWEWIFGSLGTFRPAFNFKESPHMYALSKHISSQQKKKHIPRFWWDQIDHVINYQMNFCARNIQATIEKCWLFRKKKQKWKIKISSFQNELHKQAEIYSIKILGYCSFEKRGSHFKFKCVQQFRCKISSRNTRKIHSNLVSVKQKLVAPIKLTATIQRSLCIMSWTTNIYDLTKLIIEIWLRQNWQYSHIRFRSPNQQRKKIASDKDKRVHSIKVARNFRHSHDLNTNQNAKKNDCYYFDSVGNKRRFGGCQCSHGFKKKNFFLVFIYWLVKITPFSIEQHRLIGPFSIDLR